MASSDTIYSARFVTPERIERGRANLIKCAVYRDGALAEPTSGTVSVWTAAGTSVVDAATVTITSSVAEYSIAAATVASLGLEDGWRFEWSLVMPDGITHVFRTDGALVRRALYPPVSDVDLFRLHSDLNPSATDALTPSGWDAQDYLDEAWAEIDARLVAQGRFPWLILSPSSLRGVHLYGTLERIFRDFSTSAGDGKYQALADHYAAKTAEAWTLVSLRYDADEDGIADGGRKSGKTAIWFGSRRTGGRYYPGVG